MPGGIVILQALQFVFGRNMPFDSAQGACADKRSEQHRRARLAPQPYIQHIHQPAAVAFADHIL